MNIDLIITVLFFVVIGCGVYSMTKALKENDLRGLVYAGFLLNAVATLFVAYQFIFIASL